MKRLLILSGKGGTGKTTTAGAFMDFAQARAMADCDVDAPNLHLLTRPQGEPVYTDFMGGDKAQIDPQKCIGCGLCASHCQFDALRQEGGVYRVEEYACEGCGVCQFVCPRGAVTLLPDVAGQQSLYKGDGVFSTAELKMGRGNSGLLVTAVKLAMLKNAPDCDLAIVDGSPGIGCPVMASITGMDLVLLVAEPSQSGLSDIRRLVHTVRSFDTRLALCINKWDVSPSLSEALEDFCREENIPFLGKIPFDPAVSAAVNEGKSIAQVPCPARDHLYEIFKKVSRMLEL